MFGTKTNYITIFYLLNEEGRKKSLLGGGSGKELQHIECEVNDINISISSVDAKGFAFITVGFVFDSLNKNYLQVPFNVTIEDREGFLPEYKYDQCIKYFDRPMMAEDLLAYEFNRSRHIKKQFMKLGSELEKKIMEWENGISKELKQYNFENDTKD